LRRLLLDESCLFVLSVGLALKEQILDEEMIPMGEHDVRLDKVLVGKD
jgi:5-formyltetrahydrofolate cyclo-ligase